MSRAKSDSRQRSSLQVKAGASSSTARLLAEVREIISKARSLTVRNINSLQVVSNFLIGYRIVAHEQKGKARAGYGEETLKRLSQELSKEFGKGYSHRNLDLMKKFFLTYRDIADISQTVSAKFDDQIFLSDIGDTEKESRKSIGSAVAPQAGRMIWQTLSAKLPLSWSHYVCLMGIKNKAEKSFYEIEAVNEGWSLSELKRQFDASLYERLALSRDTHGVRKLGRKGQLVEMPKDVLKNPYVLEFLGLDEKFRYTETDLESAIIDKIEHFLLELGKGFLFEARQKRFTFDEDHFFIDLVFYNRLLRCYVLIDLKIGELKHQDLGQMQMYVNYFDRYVKLDHEMPTVGIILCKKKKDTLVELTLPNNANVHASEYRLYLPSKEELKRQIQEIVSEFDEAEMRSSSDK
jgi:predicted nuclease of restriction endonuclease-like (RecB) superfamily